MNNQEIFNGLSTHKISEVTFIDKFKLEFLDETAAQITTIHANKRNQVGVKLSLNMYVGGSPANISARELLHCLSLYDVGTDKELLFKAYDDSSLSYTDVKNNFSKAVNYSGSQGDQERSAHNEKNQYTHSIIFYVWANDDNYYDIYARLSNLNTDHYPDSYVDTNGNCKNFPKVTLAINAIKAIDYSDNKLWRVPMSEPSWINNGHVPVSWYSSDSGFIEARCRYGAVLIESEKYISDSRYEIVEFKPDAKTIPYFIGDCSAWIGWGGSNYHLYGWWLEPIISSPNFSDKAIGCNYDYHLYKPKADFLGTKYHLNPDGKQYVTTRYLKGMDKCGITLYLYDMTIAESGLHKVHWEDVIYDAAITVTDAFGNSGKVKIGFRDKDFALYIK